jgi:hypothetical protein
MPFSTLMRPERWNPLERATAWEKGEAPETFPFGR